MIVCYVRCIIVGCEGVGKIIFLWRLENFIFKELIVINLIEVVDVYVNCFEVFEDEEII